MPPEAFYSLDHAGPLTIGASLGAVHLGVGDDGLYMDVLPLTAPATARALTSAALEAEAGDHDHGRDDAA